MTQRKGNINLLKRQVVDILNQIDMICLLNSPSKAQCMNLVLYVKEMKSYIQEYHADVSQLIELSHKIDLESIDLFSKPKHKFIYALKQLLFPVLTSYYITDNLRTKQFQIKIVEVKKVFVEIFYFLNSIVQHP